MFDTGDVFAARHRPPEVNEETRSWWSFQPVRRPGIPSVDDPAWNDNPIDNFLKARMSDAQLAPASQAAPEVLVRRLFYDLVGLPPAPDDVDEFLADSSPENYERLIDELLASPHYGERWGRHWLDLVRYAESNSYERDDPKPFVWRYRDYVIRSFNDDKPYDEFLVEQLAGDELPGGDRDALIATGYYRLGLWQDEPVDPVESLYNDLDDILVTTSETVLGLTVGCARCHDHKIDPIPQRDYYRLLAFFRNVQRYGVRAHQTVLRQSVREVPAPFDDSERIARASEHARKLQDVEQRLSEVESRVSSHFRGVDRDDFQDEGRRPAILQKYVGTALTHQEYESYLTLTDARDDLRENPPPGTMHVLCVKEHGREAPPTHILLRGHAHSHGEEVQPGYPSVLSPPAPRIALPGEEVKSTGRRLALVKWLVDASNPLTARVMINRIWQHHFGRGIVATPSDFGLQGSPPSHPELLDWLASEFVAGGWKLKRMHKLILTSRAYRMDSRPSASAWEHDQANEFYTRFNPRRLASEEIRDSILAVSGKLDRSLFGPSIYPTMPREVLEGQSMPGHNWNTSAPDEQWRRTIYVHSKRSLPLPLLANFDMADMDKSCPVRFVTSQPTQALAMINGEFANAQARNFARDLAANVGDDARDQVEEALRRVCQRPPTAQEVQRGLALIESLCEEEGMAAGDALACFCLVALNTNEFLYLD